jgi:hypothetical protein
MAQSTNFKKPFLVMLLLGVANCPTWSEPYFAPHPAPAQLLAPLPVLIAGWAVTAVADKKTAIPRIPALAAAADFQLDTGITLFPPLAGQKLPTKLSPGRNHIPRRRMTKMDCK